MSKIRIIYLYSVCLITLFMAVGGFVSTINSIAQYFFPESYYTSSYYDDIDGISYKDTQLENEKIRNLKSSINSFALIIVSVPIFIYHWKKIEVERKESEV